MANFFSKKSKSDDVAEQNSGADYDPSKARYHPVEDAFWKKGVEYVYTRGVIPKIIN